MEKLWNLTFNASCVNSLLGYLYRTYKDSSIKTSGWFMFNIILHHVVGLNVCLVHLTANCFVNEAQHNGEFAKKQQLHRKA